jgi:hypothetical protein
MITKEDMIEMDESLYSGWVLKLSENEIEAKLRLKQILEDQEKAEKYLAVQIINRAVINENKQLKGTLENTINQLTLRNDSVDNLKEAAEKDHQIIVHANTQIGQLTIQLEKIKKLVNEHNGSDYHARQLFDEIEQLLEE